MTIITKLKCDTLVWKKYPKKHPKRDGQIRAVFFFGYAGVTNTNTSALELSLEDLENRSSWFASNYFRQCQENPSDDPGKHFHEPALHIRDSVIGINGFLNILGVHIDDKLSFNNHPLTFLKKVYAKVGALRRLKKLVPADIAFMLYKAYILPQLEYCRPLPLGINKTRNLNLQTIKL